MVIEALRTVPRDWLKITMGHLSVLSGFKPVAVGKDQNGPRGKLRGPFALGT